MPFFFIVPAWLLCTVAGAVFFAFKQLRFLALYLVLGSTGGTLLSLVVSTVVLWVAPKLLGEKYEWSGPIIIATYLASIAMGGLVGIVGGLLAARRINKKFGWARSR